MCSLRNIVLFKFGGKSSGFLIFIANPKYDFVVGVNKYTEDIKDAFSILSEHDLSKQIIFIPMPQARMSTGKDGKYQEIQDIIEQKRIELDGVVKFNTLNGIYHIVNDSGLNYKIADLVTESYRDKVEKYIEQSDINKNKDAIDCIIAMNKANEGFDWIHADDGVSESAGYRFTRHLSAENAATRFLCG